MAAHKRNRNRFRHNEHKKRLKQRKARFEGLASFVYDIEPRRSEPRGKKRAASRLGAL